MSYLNGMQGVPLKIDKLGCLGTVSEVVSAILDASKGMKDPRVIRLNDHLAVFDVDMPEIKPLPDMLNLSIL